MDNKEKGRDMANKKKRPVVIVGGHEGRLVFFGRTSETQPDEKGGITLHAAQNCIYWRGIKGMSDLAVSGPGDQCRVGPPVKKQWVSNCSSILECSTDAAERWEAQPW